MDGRVIMWNLVFILVFSPLSHFGSASSQEPEPVVDVVLPSSDASVLAGDVPYERMNQKLNHDDFSKDNSTYETLDTIQHDGSSIIEKPSPSVKPQSSGPIPSKEDVDGFVVLQNSFVVNKSAYMSGSFEGMEVLGDFLYLRDGADAITNVSTQGAGNSSVTSQGLRLVYFPKLDQYMISEGGLIVYFAPGVDRQAFEREYSLKVKFDMTTVVSYFPVGFERLNDLIAKLNSDVRVLNIELDLIDPYIRAQ